MKHQFRNNEQIYSCFDECFGLGNHFVSETVATSKDFQTNNNIDLKFTPMFIAIEAVSRQAQNANIIKDPNFREKIIEAATQLGVKVIFPLDIVE